MKTIKRKCKECRVLFERLINESELKKGKGKFCSRFCFHKWYTRNFMIGSRNPKWKGNNLTYSGVHEWVRRKLGKSNTCSCCGRDNLKSSQIHWANINHKYRRTLKDWVRLCIPCHRKLDFKNESNTCKL